LQLSTYPISAKSLSSKINKFDVEDLMKIPPSKEPFFKKCLISKKYRTKEYYTKQINEIEDEIDEQIRKPVISSGHAFICFDTIESANYCLRKFKLSICDGTKLAVTNLKDHCLSCVQKDDELHKKSTFSRFEDIDDGVNDDSDNDEHYIMEAAKEPMDIIWSNMSGTRGLYFWRRFGLMIVCIFIVFFLTTPTVILATIKRLDILKLHEFQFQDYIPFGDQISTYLPPLLILLVNQIILLLIDAIAILEKHQSHSDFQASVFIKSVIYLNLNMLIIPAVSFGKADSLFKLIIDKNYDPREILGEMYFSDSGFFYVALIIQQG
jgi:hypothetical protein